MNKPTLEEIKKAIDEIDPIDLEVLYNRIVKLLIETGKIPSEISAEDDMKDW